MKPRHVLLGLALLAAACSGGTDGTAARAEAATPSRGADADCIRAWNARRHDGWCLSATELVVNHPRPGFSGSDRGAVGDSEWRAVIGDWYDDGELDDTHRCGAVREALARLPTTGSEHSGLFDDIRRHAEQVC